MTNERKAGRLKKEISDEIKIKYAEFLKWQNLHKHGNVQVKEKIIQWFKENGYISYTDGSFAQRHKINQNTLTQWKRNREFLIFYAKECINEENLMINMVLQGLRENGKVWFQINFPELARQAFSTDAPQVNVAMGGWSEAWKKRLEEQKKEVARQRGK